MIKRYFTKLVYYGSDEFSIKPLETLCKIKNRNIIIKDLLVLTTESRKSYNDKDNIVKNYCLDNNIKYLNIFHYDKDIRLNNIKSVQKEIIDNYDIGIICSFKYMIPSYFINNTKYGMYVIHPSLLPKYRGASPINYSLLNGDKITGCSIVGCSNKKFDAGNIYLQKEIEINKEYKYPELKQKLNDLSCDILEEFLYNFKELKKNSIIQKDIDSHAPILKKDDNFITKNDKIISIINKFRAFYQSTLKFIFCRVNNIELVLETIEKESIIFNNETDKKLFEILDLGSIFIHKNKRFLILKVHDGLLTIKNAYITNTKKINFILYHNKLVNKEYCKELIKNNFKNFNKDKIFKIE